MTSLIGPGRRSVGKWLGIGAIAVAVAGGTVMASHDFTDVPPDHPFHTQISNLVNAGVTTGCGVKTHCPDAPVTRASVFPYGGTGGNTLGPTEVLDVPSELAQYLTPVTPESN